MGNVLGAGRAPYVPRHEERHAEKAPTFDTAQPQALETSRFSIANRSPGNRSEVLILGILAALLLHAGALHWLGRHSTPPLPEIPVQVPPMTIEFSSPAPPAEPVASPPPPIAAAEPPPSPAPVVEELAPKKAPPKPLPKPKPQPPKQKAEPRPAQPTPAKAEAPTAPAAPTAAPAPAVPAAVSSPVQAQLTPPSASAGYLRNPAPEYPALALRRNWQGTVLLRVHVLASGRPSEIQVQKSSGRDLLDEAAVAAVKRWSFVPAKRGDTAQDGWVSVPIDFKLN
ncbi:energy transducer TonB [Azotobacter chroococcum]|uniref:Energy transducer TonB n=1 Tax=Azotobacter chroococcum TaxID=353 RepID=A0AAQ0C1L1_9GAMM|nr:energy transducer TonB [Azotobacter chroococcum]QQE91184.1 energy transducer TonB [Azotobacter chroococcum]